MLECDKAQKSVRSPRRCRSCENGLLKSQSIERQAGCGLVAIGRFPQLTHARVRQSAKERAIPPSLCRSCENGLLSRRPRHISARPISFTVLFLRGKPNVVPPTERQCCNNTLWLFLRNKTCQGCICCAAAHKPPNKRAGKEEGAASLSRRC